MGTTVGVWRLRLIILLVIMLTSIYLVNGFFYGVDTDEFGFVVDEDKLETDEGGDFISILFTVGDYLTFGNIDNTYARIFLNLFSTICWIVIGYIAYTFIREWFPIG